MTYRDLGAHPLPHLDADSGLARIVAPADHTPAQAASWALTEDLVDEIGAADAILLGLPVYNYGAPSTVKAWVDHLIAPGLSMDPATNEGLLWELGPDGVAAPIVGFDIAVTDGDGRLLPAGNREPAELSKD